MKHALKIVFFGTSEFSAAILDELKKEGVLPTLIVTAPDKPQGRNMVLTPPPVKVWAEQEHIDCLQPNTLRDETLSEELANTEWDLFIVASYGKIIPKELLDLPKHGTLNVHPSLLPKLRGPSPIRSAILTDEKETGVTIMLLDEKMDHGPIVAQALVALESSPESTGGGWPVGALLLEKLLAHEGGVLLSEVIPEWTAGNIDPQEQDHEKATYTKMLTKEDGLLDIENGDPYQNYLKYCAFEGWPGTYFFVEKNDKKIRIKITDASFENGTFIIKKIIPEGKKEMIYDAFLRS